MSCLMIDVDGFTLNSSDEERIKNPLVGGLILFSRNYVDKDQLRELVGSIRSIKKEILVGVDHEGGRVQRFREGFTEIPNMRKIGKIYEQDPGYANSVAKLTGWLIARELGEFDIDFSFTPVLDIDYGSSSVIGDRSFNANISPIIELAGSLARGLDHGGMQSVGKHFPGHGFIKADTHLELAVDKRSLENIQSNDMLIFESLIRNKIKGIMPSHVIYPSCDKSPAGLSKFWLQDQLRKLLKFKGAIFSDDMSMKAAELSEKNITSRVKGALVAGCDMVLVCNSPKEVDLLLGSLEWSSGEASYRRLQSMRLNKIKNKTTSFEGNSLEQAQSIILNM